MDAFIQPNWGHYRQQHHLEVLMPSGIEHLGAYRGPIEAFLKAVLHAPQLAEDVAMVVDEALTNIGLHSYDGLPDQPIALELDVVSRDQGVLSLLTALFRDYGPRGRDFRPPDEVPLVLDGEPPRAGYGVVLMHTVMDEVRYESGGPGCNQLVLRKWFCNGLAELAYVLELAEAVREAGFPLPDGERFDALWARSPGVEPGEFLLALGADGGLDLTGLRTAILRARFTLASRAGRSALLPRPVAIGR